MGLHFLLISDVLPFFKFRQHGTELPTVQRSARVLLKREIACQLTGLSEGGRSRWVGCGGFKQKYLCYHKLVTH